MQKSIKQMKREKLIYQLIPREKRMNHPGQTGQLYGQLLFKFHGNIKLLGQAKSYYLDFIRFYLRC